MQAIREAPTQVSSCEFCEIFKNTYFVERLRTVAFLFGYKEFEFSFFFSLECSSHRVYYNKVPGFPNRDQPVWGRERVSAKMVKNCMKIAKSTILGQNSMEGMGRQVDYSGSGKIHPFLPSLGKTLSHSQTFWGSISSFLCNFDLPIEKPSETY